MLGTPLRTGRRAAAPLALLVSLFLTSALAPAASAQSSLGGAPAPVQPPTPAPPTSPPVVPPKTGACVQTGFSSPWNWIQMSPADIGRALDAVKATGATYVRIGIEWGVVESTPGAYDWSKEDNLVNAATSRGLTVIGLINHTPTWAAPGGLDRTPATDVSKYAAFAGAAARHYQSRVSAWEVWNEPNISMFWTTGPNASQYVTFLKAAYSAIKAVQPSSTVISAGLSPAVSLGGNISPVDFVNQMYAAGAKGYFDALGMHPYVYPALPSDPTTASWNTWYRLADVHNIMVAKGDGDKKIWLTEYGAPTGSAPNAVSAATQAAILTEGIRLASQTPYLGPLMFYTMQDLGTNAFDVEDNFGLYTNNWTPKASLTTVTQAINNYRC